MLQWHCTSMRRLWTSVCLGKVGSGLKRGPKIGCSNPEKRWLCSPQWKPRQMTNTFGNWKGKTFSCRSTLQRTKQRCRKDWQRIVKRKQVVQKRTVSSNQRCCNSHHGELVIESGNEGESGLENGKLQHDSFAMGQPADTIVKFLCGLPWCWMQEKPISLTGKRVVTIMFLLGILLAQNILNQC